jgi:hypothetical protein
MVNLLAENNKGLRCLSRDEFSALMNTSEPRDEPNAIIVMQTECSVKKSVPSNWRRTISPK